MVPHPCPEKLPKGYPKKYLALTWDAGYGTSHINIKYAEDTLKRYSLGKELTNLEYLEALHMVKEYKEKHR